MVILLDKHFSSWLSTFCNSISIATNFAYATVAESNIMAYVNKLFTFFEATCYVSSLFNTDCLTLVFQLDCARWCRFMFLVLVTKANAVGRGTTRAVWLYHPCNQPLPLTDGMQWPLFLLVTNIRQVGHRSSMPEGIKPKNYCIPSMPNCIKLELRKKEIMYNETYLYLLVV